MIMVSFKAIAVSNALLLSAVLSAPSSQAFVPVSLGKITTSIQLNEGATATYEKVDKRTGKPTGTSFLPAEAIERAAAGNPIEKTKLAKDGTSAFVDIYEYAAKFRSGEMTWEEVEAADMNTVRCVFVDACDVRRCVQLIFANDISLVSSYYHYFFDHCRDSNSLACFTVTSVHQDSS